MIKNYKELSSYQANDRLRDGREVSIRAIRPDDKLAIQEAIRHLSAESWYLRFWSAKHDLSHEEFVYFTEVDFRDHVALVAVVQEDGAAVIAGGARYIVCEREPVVSAELAFAVDDSHQGLGIATKLLRHLIKIAREANVSEFVASVLAENHKMLKVFSNSGLPQKRSRDSGVIELRLSLDSPADRDHI